MIKPIREPEKLQDTLSEIQTLLAREELAPLLDQKEEAERQLLLGKTEYQPLLTELHTKLDELHPADVAYVLEALPRPERMLVWDLVKADRDGEILIELSDAVRESLIATMDSAELVAATEQLNTDEIADLAHDLPTEVIEDVFDALPAEERQRLREAMSYPSDAVGALMDFDMVTIREDVTLEVVMRYLRRLDELPDHTDKLFVIDREEYLKGVLPINRLLVSDLELSVARVMTTEDIVKFLPQDNAQEAAQAFERYDLVSAPVVDGNNKLVGRVTVDTVVDFIRSRAESEMLNQVGLREDEDIFASVWQSAKNRWLWLAVNLCTAFVSTRVIKFFEGSIVQIVALATLMPIVAGIAGNSGNQTMTLIIRSLALGQINASNARSLILKEFAITFLNGIVWGGIAGSLAWMLYMGDAKGLQLGLVMMSAMLLSLLVGALVGMLVPLLLQKLGRDPAMGSSVLLTFMTDSMGFFIFLGLATVFLV